MAIVQGIREKVHLPIYDSLRIEPQKQLRDEEASGTLRFFVNVQNKTKLETNLQSASLLPHYNTFEARAMRVVISDLKPEFPDDVEREDTHDVTGSPSNDGVPTSQDATTINRNGGAVRDDDDTRLQADVSIPLDTLVDLLQEARDADDGTVTIDLDDDVVTSVYDNTGDLTDDQISTLMNNNDASIVYDVGELEDLLAEFDRNEPLEEQIDPNNGSGSLIGKILYNTVTTLYVGEKIMIQMPTWFFPAGAGPYSETASLTTNGLPSPQDTFRFAEPIFIDRQQNFRVEIEIPDADVLKDLQRIYGPFFMWVVLDGYMTRGVQ
jgi:hypothetical protein